MTPEDATLTFAIVGYGLIAIGFVAWLRWGSPSGSARHLAPRKLRGVRAVVEAALADVTPKTLPPGSAGAGRELDLGELARPVTPADGLPVIRLHDCSRCGDHGYIGGCQWCGRSPALLREPVDMGRVNGRAAL